MGKKLSGRLSLAQLAASWKVLFLYLDRKDEGIVSKYLVYDVGSTYSKLTAFKVKAGGAEFIARAQHPTTLNDITQGLLAGESNFASEFALNLPSVNILASSSAAGGLKMVAMGYMPQVTAKAAKEVAMNAGARVLEVISHEQTPNYRLEILREIDPHIILLAGGTDGGQSDSLLENAALIAQANLRAKVILAGNMAAQPQAALILDKTSCPFVRVANVMPTIHDLNVTPAREAIHREFIKQITCAPGLGALAEKTVAKKVIPTPAAILMGAELLAGGTYSQEGAGGVLVLDIGGATTDVHSVMPHLAALKPEERGLVINNDKQVTFRTVEGNLGLRISAGGIVEAVGAAGVLAVRDELCERTAPLTPD
ncbi:MAG: glutamate mutase L, partial [Candidatus Adiutrix sp.]